MFVRQKLVLFFFVLITVLFQCYAEIPIMRSVVLLKGKDGAGSGFFTELNGENVVLTNSHVFLGSKDVRITDVNGGEYPYSKAYVSRTLDLSVIPVKRQNIDQMPNLKFHYTPDMLNGGAAVSACGDRFGNGVVVSVQGKFQGIGPGMILVDIPLTDGISGGPVLDDQSKQVIGIATVQKKLPQDLTKFQTEIRSFATRVDQIKFAELEEVTLEQLRQDREYYAVIAAFYNDVAEVMQNKNLNDDKRRDELKKCFGKHTIPTVEKWHTTYLKKCFDERVELLTALKKEMLPDAVAGDGGSTGGGFQPQDPAPAGKQSVSTVPKARVAFDAKALERKWMAELNTVAFKKSGNVTARCPRCSGMGKMIIRKEGRPGKVEAWHRTITCAVCHGKKRMEVVRSVDYAVIPQTLMEDLTAGIMPAGEDTLGVRLGSDIVEYVKSLPDGRYVRSGCYVVASVPGNPRLNGAEETRFWVLGDKLMRIDLVLPAKNAQYCEVTVKNFTNEFARIPRVRLEPVKFYHPLGSVPATARNISHRRGNFVWDIDPLDNSEEGLKKFEERLRTLFMQIRRDTDPLGTYFTCLDRGGSCAIPENYKVWDDTQNPCLCVRDREMKGFIVLTLTHEHFHFFNRLMSQREQGFSFD